MATKQTKMPKSNTVGFTARCGESENNFEGRGYARLPGSKAQEAKRQAISMAADEAQRRANSWIVLMTCPIRCLLKSSSVQTIGVESESSFSREGGRGYTLATATVVVKAKVRCASKPNIEN
jgi:hypothetical protein